jgi:hypothetical protein
MERNGGFSCKTSKFFYSFDMKSVDQNAVAVTLSLDVTTDVQTVVLGTLREEERPKRFFGTKNNEQKEKNTGNDNQ